MAVAQGANRPKKKSMFARLNAYARVSDAVLAVVFYALAYHSGWWMWWVSAIFCTLTAATGPVGKIFDYLSRKFLFNPSGGRVG